MKRTGVRCGIAHEDTIHLAGSTKAGTLCGRRTAKWGFSPRATLAEAQQLMERQGGKLCLACQRMARKETAVVTPLFVLRVLVRLARFQTPTICRHYAGLIVLDELEKACPEVSSNPVFVGLVKAFSANSEGDEEVIRLCQEPLGAAPVR